MSRILRKEWLAPEIALLEVEAPRIQRRWLAGQFIIIRPTANSERIPLTIVDSSAERKSITMVIQAIGKTTRETVVLEPGDSLADLVGPLGEPAKIGSGAKVVCLGGGVGVAELLPVAKAFRSHGNYVVALCGARTDAYRILDSELKRYVDELKWATDDGSYGFHGNVLQLLHTLAQPGTFDEGHVIGPIPMMKAIAEATREWGMKLHASLNPVMIDGTGMCGGCRVSTGGETHFACVDGPEFDGHQVDFAELMDRLSAYRDYEQRALALQDHECRLKKSTA